MRSVVSPVGFFRVDRILLVLLGFHNLFNVLTGHRWLLHQNCVNIGRIQASQIIAAAVQQIGHVLNLHDADELIGSMQ